MAHIEQTSVSIDQLWSIIGGGTKFTLDEIVQQASDSLTAGESFKIFHHDRLYAVPREELKAYFDLHPAPEKRLSYEQENHLLKERIKRLEDEIAMKKTPTLAPERGLGQTLNPPPAPEVLADGLSDAAQALSDAPPARAQGQTDFRAELLKDLKDAQPNVKNRK